MSLLYPNSSLRAADRRLPEDRQRQPVVGWRSWKLRRTAEGVVLQSVFRSQCREIGVTSARCHVCPPWLINLHAVPNASCQCGLYAFSTSSEAIRHAERERAPVLADRGQAQPVAGAVVGWGRVVQHGRQGWRAESARPVALLETGQPLLEEAAARYGVPLVSMRGLRLLPLEYGEVLKVGIS
jgi:hypothetical protein